VREGSLARGDPSLYTNVKPRESRRKHHARVWPCEQMAPDKTTGRAGTRWSEGKTLIIIGAV